MKDPKKIICEGCGRSIWSEPIYDDSENRWYVQCRNPKKLPTGDFCWHTEWLD